MINFKYISMWIKFTRQCLWTMLDLSFRCFAIRAWYRETDDRYMPGYISFHITPNVFNGKWILTAGGQFSINILLEPTLVSNAECSLPKISKAPDLNRTNQFNDYFALWRKVTIIFTSLLKQNNWSSWMWTHSFWSSSILEKKKRFNH